jgi:chemotaxis protein MotB
VAYADFVTAMMALFVVLWLMNSTPQVKQAIGGYFQDPTGTAKQVGSSMEGTGENFIVTKDNMCHLKDQLQRAVREVPEFDKFSNHIDMTVTNEGLRIELTESASGTFFQTGSAGISREGGDLLHLLDAELGKLPNKIAMAGHTDSKPYPPTAAYGNWELSVERANAARRLMQNSGVPSVRLPRCAASPISGCANRKLRSTLRIAAFP